MDSGEARGRASAGTPPGGPGSHPGSMLAAAPEIRYVKGEDGYVAYQVFGRGAYDLLFIGNWASNVEVMWEHPSMARYLDRLGQFARVICFDKRGAGLSDPVAWAHCRRWSTGWTMLASSWMLHVRRRPP